MTDNIIIKSDFKDLELVRRGKVRDVYEIDDKLLIVASDRMSAFDVVMDDPIPDKGKILTAISVFWFDKLKDVVENHIISINPDNYPGPCQKYKKELAGRSMLVKKAEPLSVECIVRGYISGSGWNEYIKKGSICSIPLPEGLKESEILPEPIFTPSTKAELGEHDENINFDRTVALLGKEMAEQVRNISLRIYQDAAGYARQRGIIIADTKFEFGTDNSGKLVLIDEVLTPDSSRFWPADSYKTGISPPSFDKQYVRDYLETLDWDKKAPGPHLPREVIDNTAAKYREAQERLTR